MKVCVDCGQRFEADDWRCTRCGKSPELHNGYLAFSPNLPVKSDGFSAEYFMELAKLEAGHFWFRSRNRLLIWALRRYFPHAANFMEIGCGTGFVLAGIHKEFPEWALSGSDIFSQGLDYAKVRIASASFFQMDARSIPFHEEFDVIGAFDVLEHIQEDEAVLSGIFKALKKKGGLILTVPQHKWLWSVQDEIAFHKRRYSKAELAYKVEASGFRIILVTSFVSLPLPVMVLSRLRSRLAWCGNGLLDEGIHYLRIHPILNSLFERICYIEKFFLSIGISLPAGGSLLCVSVKE